MYTDEEMLMLSGIQHYRFCPRQWALIHLYQQWEENILTVEGNLLHQQADDPYYIRRTGENIVYRSVSLISYELGLSGISDVVEYEPAADENNSVSLNRYPGRWLPHPVEYKRGHSKSDACDEVQLAAQAICLEEMYNIRIGYAWLYYGETRHRQQVSLSDELRALTRSLAREMHDLFREGVLPLAVLKSSCKNCSLHDICLPEWQKCPPASHYLKLNLDA